MSCVEVFGYSADGHRFSVSKMQLDAGVAPCLEKAREIVRQKTRGKSASGVSKSLEGLGVATHSYGDSTDVIGLVGEIVSEIYHKECKHQALFYAKWRETGTSKSNGVDLIFEDSGRLLIIECKHMHSPQSTGRESKLLEVVRGGITEHSHGRALRFLIARKMLLRKRVRELEAEGTDASQTLQKISKIESAVDGEFHSQVDLVVDGERSVAVDGEEFRSKLSKSWPANTRIHAAVLLVDGLYEATEAA